MCIYIQAYVKPHGTSEPRPSGSPFNLSSVSDYTALSREIVKKVSAGSKKISFFKITVDIQLGKICLEIRYVYLSERRNVIKNKNKQGCFNVHHLINNIFITSNDNSVVTNDNFKTILKENFRIIV